MIVTCENCDTSFNLDESLVKTTGSKVRCSKCKHVFVTYPPKLFEEETPETLDELGFTEEEDVDTGMSEDRDFSEEQMIDETTSSETDEPDDLDLSDIEKMLEVEEEPEESTTPEDALSLDGSDNDVGDNSLDLSDIEKILDEETLGDDLTGDKADEDQDLVFDLDEAIEMEAEEDQLSPSSELDLGDLEKMFESEVEESVFSLEDDSLPSDEFEIEDADKELTLTDDDGESEDLKVEMEEASDLESDESTDLLDFDMDEVEEDEALQPTLEEEPRELDFDLEEAGEDQPDLSDIEMGDVDTPEADGDLRLELEMEEEAESDTPDIGEVELSLGDESSEATDLDGVLEAEEVTDNLLDSLSMEEEESKDMMTEGELDEPREDLFGGSDEESLDEEPSDFNGDSELDFPDDAVPDIPDEEEILADEEEPVREEEDLESEEEVSEEISIPVEEKSGLKKTLVGLLIAVVVVVIGLAVIFFLQLRGYVNIPYLDKIQIPFLGKLKAPETPDAGNLNIALTSGEDARFLDSTKAGKLFIVSGKVKNDYDHPRSHIQVSGSLYARGAILIQNVVAYCGNVLSDLELQNMDASEIKARMENRSGALDSNVGLKPGGELPFMIIFSDFPEASLEEYTVTVVGSSVGGE